METSNSTSGTLPVHRSLYFGGEWHEPADGGRFEVTSPGSGHSLGFVADATETDIDHAVKVAHAAFAFWRDVPPLERAKLLRRIADVVRRHAKELAWIDALDCGNPVSAMMADAEIAASQIEFFAGMVTEMKGASIPMGPDRINFSLRIPMGVVARIVPFNHPFMFAAGKVAAPIAAGNTVVLKPPEQAPLSALRLAELIEGILPPGVFNVVTGSGKATGEALVRHPLVAKVALIGSVAAGKSVMRSAADSIKPVLLELGGKNALIAFPDADPDAVARAAVAGMNFAWCGQSCGSTSRLFLHEAIHDIVLDRIKFHLAPFQPGPPDDWSTTMGALISRTQHDRVLSYIEKAKREGARLVHGGGIPNDERLRNGFFIEPTVFADVNSEMTIASEEIFGPVLSVLRWSNEIRMLEEVNATPMGLTCSIWTRNIDSAMRVAARTEAGFIWINEVSKHFLGAPFGGIKQSGIGKEECIEEMLSFTYERNVHIRYAPSPT
jgi:betaine-aldehyde dehydrogenase